MDIMKNHKWLNENFKLLIKQNKIEVVSNSRDKIIFDVDGHNVIFKSDQGKTLYMCDCEHYTRNCKSPTLCQHRDAARLYLFYYPIFKKLKEFVRCADINERVQEKDSIDDKFHDACLLYLKRYFTDNYAKINLNKFIKDNQNMKLVMIEFELQQNRKASHSFYKMLIEDVLRAK